MLLRIFLILTISLTALNSFADDDTSTKNQRVENDYYNCLNATKGYGDEEKALCMEGEIKRLDRETSTLYQKVFLKIDRIQKWNNGNGMFRGNIKDMQEQFYDFRSRFCSFYATTMQNYSGSQSYLRNECLMQLTTDYYNRLLQMSRDYDADLD